MTNDESFEALLQNSSLDIRPPHSLGIHHSSLIIHHW
jgi:hypothetical protein